MRRFISVMAVGLLLVPGKGRAQGAAAQEGSGPAAARPSDKTGVVQGRAVGIDLSDTLQIVIDTDSGLVKLSALPTQIANLTKGDIVSFRYRNYGGELWIPLDPPGTPGAPQISPDSFGQMGLATGQITALNKSFGKISVHGLSFRAHPQLLEKLMPGQFVDVSYVQFGNVYGAVAIKPTGPDGPSPARPGGAAPGQSEPGVGGAGTQ